METSFAAISLNKLSLKNFNISKELFKKKKHSYKFLEYYKSIISKMSEIITSQNEKISDYLKDRFELYYTMKDDDTGNQYNVYSDMLEAFKHKLKEEILSELLVKCPNKCQYNSQVFNEKIACVQNSEKFNM